MRIPVVARSLAVAFALVPLAASAAPDVAREVLHTTSIELQITAPSAGATLTVTGPDDFSWTRQFAPGAPVVFNLSDPPDAPLEDGQYQYQLAIAPLLDASTRAALNAARAADDHAAIRALRRSGRIPTEPQLLSNAFVISAGTIVPRTLTEPSAHAATTIQGDRPAAPAALPGPRRVEPLAAVVAGDESIQGSLCVGLDCTSTENFGFDTFRLKENNTRIKFDDTSTATGFPNVDWQLTANDSASGGANKFSVEDVTNGKVPFTITAAAPTNSLFVASTGKVGLGTNSPVLNLHIVATDTPATRYEQTSGGGFVAQTWDVAGNEANFFVRDLTAGSRLPFRIRPGAPTSSIDIASNGFVGIGTASPAYNVDVQGDLRVTGKIIGGTIAANGMKAGVVTAAQFGGSPKQATVTFASPYPDTNYAIALTPVSGNGKLVFNVVSKTAAGFVIGTDKNVGGLQEVDWVTTLLVP